MQKQVNRNAESSIAPQFIIQGGVINFADLVKSNTGTVFKPAVGTEPASNSDAGVMTTATTTLMTEQRLVF